MYTTLNYKSNLAVIEEVQSPSRKRTVTHSFRIVIQIKVIINEHSKSIGNRLTSLRENAKMCRRLFCGSRNSSHENC